jgi:hypothetical protein
MKASGVAFVLVIAACAAPAERTDSAAISTPAANESSAKIDSVAATAPVLPAPATKTRQRADSGHRILGHDSAIQFDPKRHRFPTTADTTRPPGTPR